LWRAVSRAAKVCGSALMAEDGGEGKKPES
jgi:hypothetical protein